MDVSFCPSHGLIEVYPYSKNKKHEKDYEDKAYKVSHIIILYCRSPPSLPESVRRFLHGGLQHHVGHQRQF